MVQNLIRISGESHDSEVVAYGMDVIYSGLAALLLLLLTGWASHHLPETLVYIVSHFLLVRVMGGYHAHTRLGCLLLTSAMCFLCIWISDMVWDTVSAGNIAVSYIVYFFCVFRLAPAEHSNKKLSRDTYRKNRKRSLVYMAAAYLVVMIFWITDRRMACAFWVNITEIVISMIIGKEVYVHAERKSRKADS